MAGFVPKGRLGKKARRELDRRQRVTWGFSPAVRTVESKKTYNRKRKAHDRYDDYGMGAFFIIGLPGFRPCGSPRDTGADLRP